MQASRRDFIRMMAGGSGAIALGLDIRPLVAQARSLPPDRH